MGQMRSGADGFTVEPKDFSMLYAARIQVSDPAGRISAVLLKPSDKNPSNAVFAGPALDSTLRHGGRSGISTPDEASRGISVEAFEATGPQTIVSHGINDVVDAVAVGQRRHFLGVIGNVSEFPRVGYIRIEVIATTMRL